MTGRKSGFTLVELLIVMAIIGILSIVAISSFRGSQTKTRDSQRKSDLKQITNALETYYNDKNQYPASSVDFKINGCAEEATCEWGSQWVDEQGTIYMVKLPDDPKTELNYFYQSDGTEYQIYARLENELDQTVPTLGGEAANYGISCGSLGCNYGIASPNTTPRSGRTITAD